MFTNISWTDYFITVAILLAIYYLFIGIRYYSGDIKDLLSGKRTLKFKGAVPATGSRYNQDDEQNPSAAVGFENTSDGEFTEVEHLIERLKSIIEDAFQRKLILQEFKQYVSSVLKEYPSVKYSPLRSSINELILSECEKYEGVTLTEGEVDLLWKDTV